MTTGRSETVWEESTLINDAYLQYFYTELAVRLNQKIPEMRGVIPISDSRWRDDIVRFEEGDEENSETIKNVIEGEQRRKRNLQDKGLLTHKPLFFEKIDHP